jgi:hypothetical protein
MPPNVQTVLTAIERALEMVTTCAERLHGYRDAALGITMDSTDHGPSDGPNDGPSPGPSDDEDTW